MKKGGQAEMKTNSNGQHKEEAQPHGPHTWRKILSLLSKCSEPLWDVEEATGHRHDPREWAD
jgi:hypothetical protein